MKTPQMAFYSRSNSEKATEYSKSRPLFFLTLLFDSFIMIVAKESIGD